MSRIGRAPIAVPAGVEIKVAGNHISVKGPKGALEMDHHPDMIVKVDGNVVTVERPSDNKEHRSLHGLTRTLIANMIHGVHEEFSKMLEVNGVGYRAQKQGKQLVMNLGYSHQVVVDEIPGITIDVPSPNKVVIHGPDKQKVGQFAAEVREIFRDILFGHERILFNGDGYSEEWQKEAARRGLPNITNTVDAIGALKNAPTRLLYERYGVFTAPELDARYEVLLDQYTEQIMLEGRVVADMTRRQIIPVCIDYLSHFAGNIVAARASGLDCKGMDEDMVDIDDAGAQLRRRLIDLEKALAAPLPADKAKAAAVARDDILVKTQRLGKACDKLERLLPRAMWPMPTFDDMLYEDIQV